MSNLLAKPGKVGSTVNPGGSTVFIGAAGTKFKIHVWGVDHDYWSPAAEVTGDGDADPIITTSGYGYGRVVLTGAVMNDGDDEIGIQNLIKVNDSSVTGNTTAVSGIIFWFTDDMKITLTLIVERIRIQWRKTAAFIPISLICRVTNTDMDADALEVNS